MSKVVVVGGGIIGLVAAEAFSAKGHSVFVVEPGQLGEDFLSGRLTYIKKNIETINLLNKFDIPWSDYTIRSGILLRGNVLNYPECFADLGPKDSARIQADHYRKTRGIAIAEFGSRHLNEPGTGKNDRRALRCDPQSFVKALSSKITHIRTETSKITENRIYFEDNRGYIEFDRCIVTIPLWTASKLMDWFVPEAVAMALNVLRVSPKTDPFPRWDSIYTPYTPGNMIHRVNVFESYWDCEYNGDFDRGYARALDDAAFLFPRGFCIRKTFSRLNGHLFPLCDVAQWPKTIIPLGKFAKWDMNATLTSSLEESKKLAEDWA